MLLGGRVVLEKKLFKETKGSDKERATAGRRQGLSTLLGYSELFTYLVLSECFWGEGLCLTKVF